MVDLGIPNPLRRTRSLRGGQRNGGAWTDSGANTPDAESPGAPGALVAEARRRRRSRRA